MNKPRLVAGLGCGCFGLSLAVLLVSLALPALTNGRTSWSEAMAGVVPGAVCTGLSFLLLAGGIAWMLAARRRQNG